MNRALAFFAILSWLGACGGPNEDGPTNGGAVAPLSMGNCERLLAGQTIVAGEVCLSADGTNLYLDYSLDSPWVLEEVQTWIGTDPQGYPRNGGGNPVPGQFPVASGNLAGVTTYRVVYPFGPIGAGCGDQVYVVTHSVVTDLTSMSQEGAWLDGYALGGRNWAMGASWTIDCGQAPPLPEPTCETAFAFGGGEIGTCFSDKNPQIARWGWTNDLAAAYGENSYPYTVAMPLLAGAAHCNEDGFQVGMVYFTYDGSLLDVKYETWGAFYLEETHLYVGDKAIPEVKGKATVAPGQFPYTSDVDADHDSLFEDLAYDPWAIAHAVVCSTDWSEEPGEPALQ